jgi:hypothetical protein
MEGKGKKGKEGGKFVSFPLHSFVQWSACWALPTRSAVKNGGGYYTISMYRPKYVNTT